MAQPLLHPQDSSLHSRSKHFPVGAVESSAVLPATVVQPRYCAERDPCTMAPRRTLAEELAELATPRPAAGRIESMLHAIAKLLKSLLLSVSTGYRAGS